MRILFVSPCWPHGKAFGGQLRALQIGRALKQIGEVTIAVVIDDKIDAENLAKTAAEFQVEPAVRIENASSRAVSRRLRRAFDTKFLNVHGCLANDSDRKRLLSRLKDFDLVWVLNSRTPNILNQWSWPNSVLDMDDVPSTFQRTIWQNGAGTKEKWKAAIEMVLLKRREMRLAERFTTLCVCSEADRDYLGGGSHLHVIPNGFERPAQPPIRNPIQPPRIGFIGLYSYAPNEEGVRWFLRNCWDRIKTEIPNARFRLIGKDTDGPLKPNGADVDALGWMANPAEEIAAWSAMIIPVRHGAGTRVKIADAFSRKCPVVSTSLGAFGYDVQIGRELLLADSPADFVANCLSLMTNPALGNELAEKAYTAFLEKWTWDAIAPKIWVAVDDCLRRSQP
jgi:glycosyltransferase involved in cell wall biosynthesis